MFPSLVFPVVPFTDGIVSSIAQIALFSITLAEAIETHPPKVAVNV